MPNWAQKSTLWRKDALEASKLNYTHHASLHAEFGTLSVHLVTVFGHQHFILLFIQLSCHSDQFHQSRMQTSCSEMHYRRTHNCYHFQRLCCSICILCDYTVIYSTLCHVDDIQHSRIRSPQLFLKLSDCQLS